MLCRMIKKMKVQSDSLHLSGHRAERKERILGMEGTLTTQPVLEHVGMSIWPGKHFIWFYF